jgi:hypothetical protein
MNKCTSCNSTDIATRSIRLTKTGEPRQRYQCNDCGKYFTSSVAEVVLAEKKKSKITRYVITACQNNAEIHSEFLENLSNYCSYMDAELLIVPILYRPDDYELLTFKIPESIPHTLVRKRLKIHDEVYVMGSFNFIATSVNPLSGLDALSKGDTLIVPSPQLRMKSLAVSASRHPAILHTTGAISHPEYTSSKVGEKAKFNHSYSAVLVEIDADNDFHIRTLNGDDSTGIFYDIGMKFTPGESVPMFESIAALVPGDEHAIFACPDVERATFTSINSIVRTLKPKYVIRHDLLDCASVSHHTRKDTIKNVGKYIFGKNKIEEELSETVDYLLRTTYVEGVDFENVIVSSNHNDHLLRWMSEIDIKQEPWNAIFYHKMMYRILESMKETKTGFDHINPFEQFCKDVGVKRTRFLNRDESFRVADVELGCHSDKGTNGSKGSINQFANLPSKYVIGHSHTPGIVFGAYQTGTSSYLKLDYTSGLSSWANVHCIVYDNGKRQLIRIVNGKWKA